MTTESAVVLDALRKSYDGHAVVDDLTLDLRKGEFFSLLGPSGCGKTTTLRMVAGFAAPDAGRVVLGGRDVTALPPNKRDVNTVFQSYATFDHLSVADNVAFGLKRKGVAKAEIKTRVADMLEMVQLSALADRRPAQLSGGQRQRVALARALVNRPAVLLLDEPLAALDLKLRRQMQVELKQLQREVGITFVFVTHDQEEALTMSDRLAVMHRGRAAQVGTPEDVYERPADAFVAGFIGTSNLMTGRYADGVLRLPDGPAIPVDAHAGLTNGQQACASVRPEKVWLDDFEPGMVTVPGTVRETVYSGATTTYLVELAPGVQIAVLEQNLARSRREERWVGGERIELGWKPEHCRLLAEAR